MRSRHVLDRSADRPPHVQPRKIGEVEGLQQKVIAPPGAYDRQTARRRHGPKSVSRKNLDVATVAHLRLPSRAGSGEAIERSRLTLERKHDMEPAPWLQHSCHLPKDSLGVVDVLEHVDDPDEIQRPVLKRQALGSGQAKVDALSISTSSRQRGLAE